MPAADAPRVPFWKGASVGHVLPNRIFQNSQTAPGECLRFTPPKKETDSRLIDNNHAAAEDAQLFRQKAIVCDATRAQMASARLALYTR